MNLAYFYVPVALITIILCGVLLIVANDIDDIFAVIAQHDKRIAWMERYCEPGN